MTQRTTNTQSTAARNFMTCWECGKERPLIVCRTELLGEIRVCQQCEDSSHAPKTAVEAFWEGVRCDR